VTRKATALVALAVPAALVALLVSRTITSDADPGDDSVAAEATTVALVVEANATVERTIDGDTLVADIDGDDEHVRLIGIDTPESVAQDRPDECYGKQASERLRALLPPGTPVRLERDVEPRDQYDRLLAYVYRATDGLFVNETLVAEGYAEAKAYPPNTTLHQELLAAQSAARAARKGFWGACGGPDVPLSYDPDGDR
jgi:endonuclease YncB( thermonuclease family)